MVNWRIYMKINSFKHFCQSVLLYKLNSKTICCKKCKFCYFSPLPDSKSICYIHNLLYKSNGFNHWRFQEFVDNFARNSTKRCYIRDFALPGFGLNKFYCSCLPMVLLKWATCCNFANKWTIFNWPETDYKRSLNQ